MQELIIKWITWIAETITSGMTTLLTAAIIILIGFIIGKASQKILKKSFKEIGLNKILREITGVKISIEEIITYFVMYFIYFISIVMALRHLGIATDVLNVISIVIIVLIGIFILLSIKDFIPNVMSGIIIYQKGIVKKGEIISFNNIIGKVTEVTLLETRLETKKGDIIIVPNANLTRNEIIKKKRF